MKTLFILSLILSVSGISGSRGFEHIVVTQEREQKSLRGIVKDPNHGIITGVTVAVYTHPEVVYGRNNVKNQNVRQKRLAIYTTGKDGRFNFSGLKPGDYELRFEASGFNTLSYCIKFRPDSLTGTKKDLVIGLEVAT